MRESQDDAAEPSRRPSGGVWSRVRQPTEGSGSLELSTLTLDPCLGVVGRPLSLGDSNGQRIKLVLDSTIYGLAAFVVRGHCGRVTISVRTDEHAAGIHVCVQQQIAEFGVATFSRCM